MHLKFTSEQISADGPAVFVGPCIIVIQQVAWVRKRTGKVHEWKHGKEDEMDKRISEGGGVDGLKGGSESRSPCDYVQNIGEGGKKMRRRRDYRCKRKNGKEECWLNLNKGLKEKKTHGCVSLFLNCTSGEREAWQEEWQIRNTNIDQLQKDVGGQKSSFPLLTLNLSTCQHILSLQATALDKATDRMAAIHDYDVRLR